MSLFYIILIVGCVLRPIDSEVILRWHPHLLSLVKDMKLGKYTVPTGNRTPGRRVAVHISYTSYCNKMIDLIDLLETIHLIGDVMDFNLSNVKSYRLTPYHGVGMFSSASLECP